MPGLMLGLFIVVSEEDDDEAAAAATGCGDEESPHFRADAAEEKDAVE